MVKRHFITAKLPIIVIAFTMLLLLYFILWHESPSTEMNSSPQNNVVFIKEPKSKQNTQYDMHNKPKIIPTTSSPTKPPISRRQDIINHLIYALQPENRKITLVINSCGRLDLLNETITSFLKYYPHKKYPLHEKMIIDDCRQTNTAHELIKQYYPQFQIILTANNQYEKKFTHRDERITNAMDKIWKQVKYGMCLKINNNISDKNILFLIIFIYEIR